MSTELSHQNRNANDYLVAHRGYTQCFPENSMLAIQAALDVGARYIEIDIQLSSDTQPMIFHDRDLSRLCEQANAIHDYTFDELKSFSNFSPDRFKNKYKNEKIASLNEVVDLFKLHPNTTLFVELKRNSLQQHGIDTMLETVLSCLAPIIDQCVIISFSLEALRNLRKSSSIPIGAVIDEWNDAITIHADIMQELNPEYFFCDIDSLPPSPHDLVKIQNCKIVTYECTDINVALKALERGVDLIETFDIKNMKDQMNTRGMNNNEL